MWRGVSTAKTYKQRESISGGGGGRGRSNVKNWGRCFNCVTRTQSVLTSSDLITG